MNDWLIRSLGGYCYLPDDRFTSDPDAREWNRPPFLVERGGKRAFLSPGDLRMIADRMERDLLD